ncbi:PLP-dependent aminotransferase family protein [Vreelandella populi]|uniref:PLP-dependent aminotransferase family protein n=1 Tax=Vreelandella populi TaxID=2498858 RepID=A0A3S0WN97_9GAMM|nr:PLP-dependent aminotransferase family protein [Halomonas populi]RUR39117.1 PLP-dependent aminotransferase family protein [Halomonas populi]RUR46177.1 PLP-dependent aminotransferase family protein [Halomonas populi]
MMIGVSVQKNDDRCLQEQLRTVLLEAIHAGSLPSDEALPSCRKLSHQLGISRNTVAIVYESLTDDGYIVSRPRSGYYLHPDYYPAALPSASPESVMLARRSGMLKSTLQPHALRDKHTHIAPNWHSRLTQRPSRYEGILKPSNWRNYPYPFIYGQLDTQQFPLPQWRSVTRRLLSGSRDKNWLNDRIDQDDPLLIEQLCKRVLPRRGIFAQPDEILITLGSQNALYMLSKLLLDSRSKMGMENPGYREAANVFQHFGASIEFHQIDSQGMVLSEASTRCDYLYITPSHQVPTGITMSQGRRHSLIQQAISYDQIIIEDDYDAELHGDKNAFPALKAGLASQRVIYLGSFSKAFAPGLRLGYIVADSDLIDEMRALRRLMYRHPPGGSQQQVAQFIAQGHYERHLKTHTADTDRRRDTLREALERYIPEFACHSSPRASAFWLKTPASLDTQRLAWQASQHGVLIEPGFQHFFDSAPPRHFLRLGFQAISTEQIVPGIQQFADACLLSACN